MRDWAFALMVGLIFIALASCTAVVSISDSNERIETLKIKLEHDK